MRRALPGSMRAAAGRVGVGQPAVEGADGRRLLAGLGLQLGPHLRPPAGHGQPVDDRLQVETGAADQQRPVASGLDSGDGGLRLGLEPG